MALRNRLLRPAGVVGALCLAASLAFAGSGSAQAAGSRTAAPVTHAGAGATTLTFTKAGSGVSPMTAFTCSVTYPYVTDTYSTGEIAWSAQVSCSISLHMQGTTVLYQWGSSSAYAFGSSYNNISSFNSSSGSIYGIHSGLWGVNNNVDIFPPAGYTTTLGAGCYYVNGSPSDIHCTATTGPITAG
jgi:hypothetical protein